MTSVTSADGTRIAYDRTGSGPPVILVGGAFSYRAYPLWVRIAERLAASHTVIRYDRRGRGDSTDAGAYRVGREIEDLDALLEVAGGSASVWGMSSGAVLALRAAAAGSAIDRLAVYQPPFAVDASANLPPEDFGRRLDALLAAGRRAAAVHWFLTRGMGMPAVIAYGMRLAPFWRNLTRLAHTLPYDLAVMGDTIWGRPLAAEPWGRIDVPTLVLAGAKAPESLRAAARELAAVLPDAQARELARQSHAVKPAALVPELRRFFAAPVPAVA